MRAGAVVVVLVVVSLATIVTASYDARPSSPAPTIDERTGAAQVDGGTEGTAPPPSTNMTIRLRADGDAEWIVTTSVALAEPNDTRAFGELGERYESGRADVGPSVVPFEQASEAASEVTGREMRIENVSRTARIENGSVGSTGTTTEALVTEPGSVDARAGVGTGQLVLRFTWTNFSRTSGQLLRVGDAFRTPSGTWLPGLGDDQVLVIVPPPGYGVNSAPPVGIENGTARWTGPETFEPGYLSITYKRGLRQTPSPTTPSSSSQGSIGSFAAFGLFGAVVLGVVVLLYFRSGRTLPSTADGEDGDRDGPVPGTTTDRTTDGTPTGAVIDEELLSDEERVERLLEANGGRMRQAEIVNATDWSNAKVSQLLSAMDEDGRIDKLRLGRENLIALPDEDIGDIDTR